MLNLVLKPPKIDPLVLDYLMHDRRLTAQSLLKDWFDNQPLLGNWAHARSRRLFTQGGRDSGMGWGEPNRVYWQEFFQLFFSLDRKDLLKLICSFSRFGRRKTLVAYMVLAGVTVVAVSLIPNGTNNTGIWDPRIYFILISISREYSPTI